MRMSNAVALLVSLSALTAVGMALLRAIYLAGTMVPVIR